MWRHITKMILKLVYLQLRSQSFYAPRSEKSHGDTLSGLLRLYPCTPLWSGLLSTTSYSLRTEWEYGELNKDAYCLVKEMKPGTTCYFPIAIHLRNGWHCRKVTWWSAAITPDWDDMISTSLQANKCHIFIYRVLISIVTIVVYITNNDLMKMDYGAKPWPLPPSNFMSMISTKKKKITFLKLFVQV